MKALIGFSGGIDSLALAYRLTQLGYNVHGVYFRYGQHDEEMNKYVSWSLAQQLGIPYREIVLPKLKSNVLTEEIGEIPEAWTPQYVVPFRNGVFLALLSAIASGEGYSAIGLGVHRSDRAWPDCLPQFYDMFSRLMRLAHCNAKIYTNLQFNKSQLVRMLYDAGEPWRSLLYMTRSCYFSDPPCGKCVACQERRKAFEEAEVPLEEK